MNQYITGPQQDLVRDMARELVDRSSGAFCATMKTYYLILRAARKVGASNSCNRELLNLADDVLEYNKRFHRNGTLISLSNSSLPDRFCPERLQQGREEARDILEALFGPRTPEMGEDPFLSDWPAPQEPIASEQILLNFYETGNVATHCSECETEPTPSQAAGCTSFGCPMRFYSTGMEQDQAILIPELVSF